jgi:hypothetical protein
MAAREPAAGTADPAAVQGQRGNETAKTDGAKEAAVTRLTAMHIAGLAVLILGILVVLLIVMPEFNDERDTATGVLGVVIPAFATIGAALFGITVGYNAGQSSGKETGKAEGKAEGEAGKDEAAAVARGEGRKEVAEQVAEHLQRGTGPMTKVVESLTTALHSPAGEDVFVVDSGAMADAPLRLEVKDLAAAPESFEAALGYCRRVLAE